VYLLDVMGELIYFYGLSELAFVGGSLIPRGGHNFMEAALAGTAIVCGDSLYNFEAIAEEFRAAGAMAVVETPRQLLSEVRALLSDPDRRSSMQAIAYQTVLKQQGALQLVEAELKNRIKLEI
jgi:3-deoxy-D-manno-octulosonic-acid transferase